MQTNVRKLYRKARKALLEPVTGPLREQLAVSRRTGEAARARADALQTEVGKLRELLAAKDVLIQQVAWLGGEYKQVPPIPPKHLQVRVSGDHYPAFFQHGAHMLRDIEQALDAQGQKLADFERILDFGCGCGRFLIPLGLAMAPARLHGCDIDGEAISWLRQHYPQFAGLYAGPHMPRTEYADDSFDLLYSVSVFTHLPEDMQFAWLDELRRITRPGSWLAVSTHGIKFLNEMPPRYHDTFRQRGFYYLDEAEVTDGLPKFYKGAYHLPSYIEREWSNYFRVVSVLPQGIGAHQDLIVLQNIK